MHGAAPVCFESLCRPDEPIVPHRIAQRLFAGDIIVVRRCLGALGIEADMTQTTHTVLAAILGDDRARQVIDAGVERLHALATATELLAITEALFVAFEPGSRDVGARVARRLLGRRRPVFVERTPNVRVHVPFASDARVMHGEALEALRRRRGEGKVTPHAAHVDSWFNCPRNALNIWIALGRVVPGNGLSLFPAVYQRLIPVDEAGRVCDGARLGAPVTLDLAAGDAVLFAGEHLHASELNRTQATRVAISYRLTLSRPRFPGRHTHHYAWTALRRGPLARFAEIPARLQWSFLRQRLGTSRWVSALPRHLQGERRVQLRADRRHTVEPLTSSMMRDDVVTIPAAAVRPGLVTAVDDRLCVARDAQGQPRAFRRRCPHEGADLAGARVDGDRVICPWHNVAFDLRRGGMGCEGLQPLRLFPARENGTLIDVVRRDNPHSPLA